MKSKRFQPIQELAQSSAAALARAMADADRRVVELERQMERLRAYRDEYSQSAAGSARAIDAVSMQNYRSFLDRLNDALRAHAQQLAVARADYEARRVQWSAKRVEAESLSRAIDRFRHEERRAADRREQRDGDEAAIRLALRGTPPGG